MSSHGRGLHRVAPIPPRRPRETDPAAGRIRSEQLATTLRMTPLMMSANMLTGALVVVATINPLNARMVLTWYGLMLLAAGRRLLLWWRARGRVAPDDLPYDAIAAAAANALLLGLLWSFVPLVLYPAAGPELRVFVGMVSAGLMCGAIALATIPEVGISYAGPIAASLFLVELRAGGPYRWAMLSALGIYCGVIGFAVLAQGSAFIGRARNKILLENQNEVVKLLLCDFEEHASDWLWQTNGEGRLEHVSARFAEVAGQPEALLRDVPLLALFGEPLRWSEPMHRGAAEELERRIAERAGFRDLVVPVEINGEERWWSLTGSPSFDGRGEFLGYRGVGSDVTAAKHSEAQIAHMALYDGLTDLPNRTLFHDNLIRACASSRQQGEGFALLSIDLDHFKTVNDTLGHQAGDALLIAVAERLRSGLRPSDHVARLGGDEFAVLQTMVATAEEAAACARHIIERLSQAYEIDGVPLTIGVSIGIAIAPGDGTDPHTIVKNADLALYRAKNDGRGTFRFFEAEMDARAQARRALEFDLRNALLNGELSLMFQPLVDLRAGRVTAFEALLRWAHPVRGVVSPTEFIPVAEEIGIIGQIGAWVIEEACTAAASWPPDVRIAVNCSALQFKNAELFATIRNALTRSGLAPHRLEIEITESIFLDPSPVTFEVLHQLRELGIRIALDDFGTGYSSLSYLRSFPFDKIKIDRSFVRDLGEREDSHAIIQAITGLAGRLGITTTAEGVETENQLWQLAAEGCNEVQGFLFSPPRSAAELQSQADEGWAGWLGVLPDQASQPARPGRPLATISA